MNRIYTPEHKAFIEENYPGRTAHELVKMFNSHFGTQISEHKIISTAYRYGYKNGRDTTIRRGVRVSPETEFKKGQTPWNKGLKCVNGSGGVATQFKKGQRPHTYRPVGSERVTVDGYTEIKVADPKTWKQKQRMIWEQANGPIPKGYKVIFADGDRANFDIENLLLISSAQLAVMNARKLITEDPELTKTGAIIAELHLSIYKRKKQKQKRIEGETNAD